MNKEEVIENLEYQNEKFFGGQSETLKMAISLLKEEPAPFDFELFQAGLMDMPEGITNGEVMQALFPNERIGHCEECTDLGDIATFDDDWWNAPYQKEGE